MFGNLKGPVNGRAAAETGPKISESGPLLDQWFWEESIWAGNYTHELERRLYDLKERCKKCPYRNQDGSGCHDQIPD